LRDEQLGREPKDIDIAVCGTDYDSLAKAVGKDGRIEPLEVHGRLVGVRVWGEWTGKEGVEVALARSEVSTGPGYHEFDIRPDPLISIEEDLARRDFTCNAIARNIRSGEVIDPFGGVEDSQNRRLRTVSPDSFRDDALRMLRGLVRISHDDFEPDEQLLEQMRLHAHQLHPDAPNKPVSGERVRESVEKILSSKSPIKSLRIARDTGVLENIIPEFKPAIGFQQESKYHDLTADEHIFLVTERAAQWNYPLNVRLACLFHDIGKPASAWRGPDGKLHYYHNAKIPDCPPGHETLGAQTAVKVWERWGGDKRTSGGLSTLIKYHMFSEDRDSEERYQAGKSDKLERNARRFLAKVGPDRVDDLLCLRRCDRAGKQQDLAPDWDTDINRWETIVDSQRAQPLSLKQLKINGDDLLQRGFQGRAIGQTLHELLKKVVDAPEHNRPEQLLKWADSQPHTV
jgi:hypothetical protein